MCRQQACANLSLGGSIPSEIAHAYDGGGLGDNGGGESAYSADETSTCGWNERTTTKMHNPLTRPFPPASLSYEGDGLVFQEEGTANCTEDYDAKSMVIALTTRTCHLDGHTSADTGWQVTMCAKMTMLLCFASTLAQNKRLDAPDRTNSTISETCVVGCATGP